MTDPGLAPLVQGLAARGRACNHRQLLVLAGSPGWCRAQAEAVLSLWPPSPDASQTLWIGKAGPEGAARVLPPRRACHLLGSESGLLVFDTHEELDPDALAVAGGTLCGGGLMLLLMPHALPEAQPPSPFRRWFEGSLARAPGAVSWVEGAACPALPGGGCPAAEPVVSDDPQCLTPDQARAVQSVLRVVHGHRRRPLVLTADRGRGKSVALAIAAARLLREAPRRLVVTAPRREALATFYGWLEEELQSPAEKGGVVRFNGGELRFIPPDLLIRERPPVDLLMVDEAAAIPAPLLETLVKSYSRVVFSTTVHGYEGTGRGFALRFQPALQRLAPGWREERLTQPVRWAAGDPLERWIFDALLLAAVPGAAPVQADPDSCAFSHWPPGRLLADPGALSQLFALLVQAHYRTTPGDLRDLLDAPDLDTWVLTHGNQVLGAVLVAREGGFSPVLSRAIWAGRRRPRGHLLPQVLAAQAGWLDAPELRYWRIVRIAVHPSLQGRGLGTRMLEQLVKAARGQGMDMLGSSFGFTPDLMSFWSRSGFEPLRLGLRRDASSGCHSLLVGQPLSLRGRSLGQAVSGRFSEHLPAQLASALADLEPEVVRTLLAARGQVAPPADTQEWLDRLSFVAGQRGLAQCLPVLRRWAWELLRSPAPPEDLLAELLIRCLLQQQPVESVCSALNLAGRKELLSVLRKGLLPYLRAGLPPAWVDLLDCLLGSDLQGQNGYKEQ